jgi:gluconate 2-dehydrogenase alpha chain
MSERRSDVLIVGLGAAGATAASTLVRAGLAVTALEAGPRFTRSDFRPDELRSDVRNYLGAAKVNHEIPTWRPHPAVAARRVRAGTNAVGAPTLMGNGVGGTSIGYAALSFRLSPWTFRMRTALGAGALPEGSTVVDWPLDYDELAPYYERVEHAIGVCGPAAEEGKRAFPMPPLRRSGYLRLMHDAAQRLGWHPAAAPAAINSVPRDGRPECTYCGWCSLNGCHNGAKGSMADTLLADPEVAARLNVVAGARVLRIEVGRDGRVSGVTAVVNGRERRYGASVVLLAAYTYENVRLLLHSKSAAFPAGLSNSHGMVGRHFMSHTYVGASGVIHGQHLKRFGGSPAQAVAVRDFDGSQLDPVRVGGAGGALLLATMQQKPIQMARSTPPWVPQWGSEWKRWLHEYAGSVASVGASLDWLPHERNSLDLDPTITDPQGVPVVRVTLDLDDDTRRVGAFILERCRDWVAAAGATQIWGRGPVPVPVNSHAYGGTRMGDDPADTVVDRWGFSHEVPNLALIGASTFPTSGSVNPTTTVQALAWRSADRLVADWRTITA